MSLADKVGLREVVEAKVDLGETKVASAGANPAGKTMAIIAGMAAGADCIDALGVLRAGGMKNLFTDVYAPATLCLEDAFGSACGCIWCGISVHRRHLNLKAS